MDDNSTIGGLSSSHFASIGSCKKTGFHICVVVMMLMRGVALGLVRCISQPMFSQPRRRLAVLVGSGIASPSRLAVVARPLAIVVLTSRSQVAGARPHVQSARAGPADPFPGVKLRALGDYRLARVDHNSDEVTSVPQPASSSPSLAIFFLATWRTCSRGPPSPLSRTLFRQCPL